MSVASSPELEVATIVASEEPIVSKSPNRRRDMGPETALQSMASQNVESTAFSACSLYFSCCCTCTQRMGMKFWCSAVCVARFLPKTSFPHTATWIYLHTSALTWSYSDFPLTQTLFAFPHSTFVAQLYDYIWGYKQLWVFLKKSLVHINSRLCEVWVKFLVSSLICLKTFLKFLWPGII
jgi:hypothetical protein